MDHTCSNDNASCIGGEKMNCSEQEEEEQEQEEEQKQEQQPFCGHYKVKLCRSAPHLRIRKFLFVSYGSCSFTSFGVTVLVTGKVSSPQNEGKSDLPRFV